MTSIDYAAVRADLASRKDAIGQILEGFDRLLGMGGGMRDTGRIPVAALPAPKKSARAKSTRKTARRAQPTATQGRGKRADPELLARARMIAGKDGLRAAAEAVGLGLSTLYSRAKIDGWKVAPAPRGRGKHNVLKSGERICSHCGARTMKDPCNVCGNPARKTAA